MPDPAPNRDALFRRLDAAAAALDTKPQWLFIRHRWTVGLFPRNRPLPPVRTLTDLHLRTLVMLAEQDVMLLGERAPAPVPGGAA